jgi:hypothetical protein
VPFLRVPLTCAKGRPEKSGPGKPGPRKWGSRKLYRLFFFYFEDGPLVPLGEAAGGQGVPLGETPAEFRWLLPEVEGDEPELDEPGLEDPELVEPDEPVFGLDEPVVPAVPGNVPHGEPLGLVPGVFVVFGFTVEG